MKPNRTAAGLARSAEEFLEARKFDACLYVCALAVAEDPQEPLPYFVRGRCLAAIGRFDDALPFLQTAVALQPDNADFHAAFAGALDDTGYLEEACEHYSLALEHNRDLIEPLLGRAEVRQRMGDFRGALEDLDAYLALRPRSAHALVHRGISHLAAGRRAQAQEDFDRAVALEPAQAERVQRLTGGL